MLNNINYNPDVLTCLANLSNDEVFTPPDIVNQMLDLLPSDLWQNKEAKFLDPVTKSGVFLREIAKRLNSGLAEQIPDSQTRLNHIFKHQLYGISITELTGFLARRSVYCCKKANSPLSICTDFDNEQGNIVFKRIEHTWQGGKCTYCGASQATYDRDDALETHAYQFIHTDNLLDIFGVDMKFDVIIGNPPYQLSDGGAQMSASPIYHKFILQAKKLSPRYLSMIIPARWYSGGKGLDDFRDEMLKDTKIKILHDFHETSDVFPGLNIRGGICYFLWEKDYNDDCEIINHNKGETITIKRPLLEKSAGIFVRYNQSISILEKVQKHSEASFLSFVSSRKPFGLSTNFTEFKNTKNGKDNILLHRFGSSGYISIDQIEKNQELVNQYKIFISKASPGSDVYPHQVLGRPIISEPNSACTETYIVIGPFKSRIMCENVKSYISTMFFRFLVVLIKSTQDVPRRVYQFVPIQDFTQSWTDEKLYKKYGLTQEEIAFIESMIRPMELES